MNKTEELTPAQELGYNVGDWFEVVDTNAINGSVYSKICMGLSVKLLRDDGSSTPLFETGCGHLFYIHLTGLKPLNNKDQPNINSGEVLYTKEQFEQALRMYMRKYESSCPDKVIEEMMKCLYSVIDPEYSKYLELKNKFEF